jgi:hypothetical protein
VKNGSSRYAVSRVIRVKSLSIENEVESMSFIQKSKPIVPIEKVPFEGTEV